MKTLENGDIEHQGYIYHRHSDNPKMVTRYGRPGKFDEMPVRSRMENIPKVVREAFELATGTNRGREIPPGVNGR